MIGEGLRKLRKRRNISQKDLAQKLGVSRQAISMWEADKRELRARMLNKIARIFDVTLDEIIKLQNIKSYRKEESMARKKTIKPKVVNFVLKAPDAKQVKVTGDFKSWDIKGIPMKKGKTGEWKTGVELMPGRYEYKYIVDNQWWTDPSNNKKQNNALGEVNSVLEVAG